MTVERVSDPAVPAQSLITAALPHQAATDAAAAAQALAAAVDDAVIGDVLADLPEASPNRALHSATDFSSLYVRHRSGMAAHARRFLRDPRDVDEVVQETFLRLFLAISEIETELQALAFARRTLTNLCIDRYRADRRRPTLVALDASPIVNLLDGEELPDPVLQAEDAAIVREALARLSPLHRAALVKREIEEKTLPQIAAELGVAEESVKHLLFRARRALRRLLVGTSVEPGIDLTAAEVVDLANRRLARSMMQGANMLIVLVVVAVVAAVGVRPLLGRSAEITAPGGSTESAVTGGAADPVVAPKGGSRHHVGRSGRSGNRATHRTASVVATNPPTHPVTHVPTKPAKSPTGSATTSRAHLKLSGPLTVTGAPQIAMLRASTAANGTTSAAESTFTAPTDQGTFQLEQSLTTGTNTTSGTSVAVSPAFVVGDAVERPTMTGSTAAVGNDADGNVTVSVTAGAAPDLSTNAFPLTSVTADLVLSPDLSRVLSESVVLTAQPPAVIATPPAAATPPNAPTSPSADCTAIGPAAAPSTAPAPGCQAAGDDPLPAGPPAAGVDHPAVVENLRYVS
ncbi:MAG TPA: RNA polymerase sigma factor [Mycobacteriales bacterium]|nr:RNA polymerase sigma factor [Mycobacteriales bacterium]